MATVAYQQVAIQKRTEAGHLVDKVFVPQKLAVKDTYLECKRDGVWSNGWLITEVFAGTRTEQEAIAARDRHKDHRKGTDI